MRRELGWLLGGLLVLALTPTPARAAPDAPDLAGTYVLDGTHDEVIPTHGTLSVASDGHGGLTVTRTIDGSTSTREPLSWTADGTAVEGRTITVTFRVTTDTPGVTGELERLVGSARGRKTTVYTGTYTFTNDGLRVTEALAARSKSEGAWASLTSNGARDLAGLSLGELANEIVPRVFDDLVANLGVLGPDTPPPDVRDLRYKIAQLRDLVDVFAYCYPDDKAGTYAKIRRDLNDGYERLGAFKDLFDAQGITDPAQATYDPAQVKKLRKAALAWQASFSDPEKLAGYRDFLSSARKSKLVDRDSSELGRFFWNEAGITPRKDLSGVENLARLERKLLDSASDDLDQVSALRKVHKGTALDQFHDFRKQLRVATKVATYFPQIFSAGDPDSNLRLLVDAVDRYGAVHDKVIAYDIAREHGDDAQADALVDEIARDWKDLRGWQKERGVGAAIIERRESLIDREKDLDR